MTLLSGIARRLGFNREESALGAPTEENIRQWLTARLARQLRIAPSEVRGSKRFDEYGLDSRVAVQVSGELEKLVERRLSPALLFEYPTIDELTKALAAELGGPAEDT